jgi:hypothetical protein
VDAVQVKDDEAVAQVVAAEHHGLTPRVVMRSEVELGEQLGEGGEGRVVRGTFQGKQVAVKIISLKGSQGARDSASMKMVIATSYIAGIASDHVCKLLGVSWQPDELWCAPLQPSNAVDQACSCHGLVPDRLICFLILQLRTGGMQRTPGHACPAPSVAVYTAHFM